MINMAAKTLQTNLYIQGQPLDWFSLSHKQESDGADTLSFESPDYLDEGLKIYLHGRHRPFGGVITTRNDTPDGFSYDCQNFSHYLKGKGKWIFQNRTASQILKEVLKGTGVSASGIMETTFKIPKLAFNGVSRWNICHQVATLMDWEFRVNSDGVALFTPGFSPIERAFIFHPGVSILDYDFTDDITDLITQYNVYGKDDKFLGSYKKDVLFKRYGIIDDILNDTTLNNLKDASKAADKALKESERASFSGQIVVPPMEDLGSGIYGVVPIYNKRTNEKGWRSYYFDSVELNIDDSTFEQAISLLSGKPPVPDEWIYQSTDQSTTSITSNSQSVVYSHCRGTCGCGPDNSGPWTDRCWKNYCPKCGKVGQLYYGINLPKRPSGYYTRPCPKGTKLYDTGADNPIIGGHIFCCACGADFCCRCGKDHGSGSHLIPSAVDCKAVTQEAESITSLGAFDKTNPIAGLQQIWSFVRKNSWWTGIGDCGDKHGNYCRAIHLLQQYKEKGYMVAQCGRQASVVVYLAHELLGLDGWAACGHNCGEYGHSVAHIVIPSLTNNSGKSHHQGTHIFHMDTVCHVDSSDPYNDIPHERGTPWKEGKRSEWGYWNCP